MLPFMCNSLIAAVVDDDDDDDGDDDEKVINVPALPLGDEFFGVNPREQQQQQRLHDNQDASQFHHVSQSVQTDDGYSFDASANADQQRTQTYRTHNTSNVDRLIGRQKTSEKIERQ